MRFRLFCSLFPLAWIYATLRASTTCKGFYLCLSCSQKRTLLFSENMVNDVLLLISHRQYVFAIPKCLCVFFKHDQKLFGEVSRLIFQMIQSFYNEAAGTCFCSAFTPYFYFQQKP
ncbi:MAG: hypothetical protein FVQ80_18385 [Planctomycetes bacterium]|nr:hypothetical protein [Planctomycetota bacterium]